MIRVLFVCTGNTCRSPMAEAILKNKGIPGIEVKSAGVYAAEGMEASMHAKQVLEDNEMGQGHSSSPLTADAISWATHIFTMTEGHKSILVNSFPAAMDKTFTLKEFVYDDKYDRDISDPYGGSQKIYRETFEELQEAISRLINKLEE
ncbi:protein-tyrosine phosphatase [Bacillus sp. OV322]|uniref:low molecular weight protein arginine phosphatase n=1 Tax=Bacillus sp. OV322 TaxID=1882764 RepID=UPI0008F2122C|nr:low molecular weight protein arginine phosphatase [Bacillus sp. OV322]SFC21508.1 protein-tyrosine phosphatase [Bacillus sp. OV322]